MTADQTAVNHAALIAAAARLEGAGYDGDSYRFVEGLVVSVLSDGYRRLGKPPAPRGPSSTEEGRAEARRIYETTRNARHEESRDA